MHAIARRIFVRLLAIDPSTDTGELAETSGETQTSSIGSPQLLIFCDA